MKNIISERYNKIVAVSVFYIIAVLLRYVFTEKVPEYFPTISDGLFFRILTGVGPFVGAIIALYLFGRKKKYSNFGTSVLKSVSCFLYPIIGFFLFDLFYDLTFFSTKIVISCLVYAYFEEYGWRGYLQSELINMRKIYRILLIAMLWFVWHLNFELSVGNIVFFAILLLGSWGIGQIAIKSHSIIACACFHSVINIMQNIHLTMGVYVLLATSVAFWFFVWYKVGRC